LSFVTSAHKWVTQFWQALIKVTIEKGVKNVPDTVRPTNIRCFQVG
jgi:hypothetical protein